MSDVDPGERAWYAKPGFIAAAAVLALIVVGGGVAIGVNQLRAEPTPPPSTSTTAEPSDPSEPSASPPATADESVCGLTDSEEQSSLTAAPDTEWTFVGTVSAPSTDAGPGVVETDGFRSCYARTAEGALLSVANYVALTSEPALSDRLIELFYDVDELPVQEQNGYSEDRLTIAGFRVLSFNPTQATIELAVRIDTQQNQLVALPVTVYWHDGDWKLTLESLAGAPTVLSSLGGYTAWSPDGP